MNEFKRDIEKAEYVMLDIIVVVSFSTVAYVMSEIFN
jgi:hypothetical protein